MCLEFPEFPCLSERDNLYDHRSEETCAGLKCLGVITSVALSVLSMTSFFHTGDPFFTILTGVFSFITVYLMAPCCCSNRTNHLGVSILPLPVSHRRPQWFVHTPEVRSPPVYRVQSERRVHVGERSYVPEPPPLVQHPESHVRVGDRRQPGMHVLPQQSMRQPPPLQGRVQVGDQRQPGLDNVFDPERRVAVGKKH